MLYLNLGRLWRFWKSGVRTVRAPQGGLSCPYGAIHLQAGPYGRFREVGGIWCGKSGAVHGGSEPPPYEGVWEVFGKSEMVWEVGVRTVEDAGPYGRFREVGGI